ncbi:hypothetical protein MtrunA17_Chr5g0417351 [Medicago truncatula]|uniref:Uncharacterized protein n=1 Tax=Medicago truncatula TaxID=3880 RepID=A0A396HPZ1_MEDTR|nr:hypothetical protein MtrunA17_Chr5g0417351 [Medicago truncatula]
MQMFVILLLMIKESFKIQPQTLLLRFHKVRNYSCWNCMPQMLLPKRHHQCFLEDFYKLGGCARRILKKKGICMGMYCFSYFVIS